MARKVHGGRALLNQEGHHSTAVIVAEIEDTKAWPLDKGRNGADPTSYNIVPNTKLILTDCSEKVNIELDIGTDARLQNSLHKIDTMLRLLRKARKGLIVEHERLVKRKACVPTKKDYGNSDDSFDQ